MACKGGGVACKKKNNVAAHGLLLDCWLPLALSGRLFAHVQVFGRDKAMSIVALMRLDGLEPHLSSMMEAAAQVRSKMTATGRGCRKRAGHGWPAVRRLCQQRLQAHPTAQPMPEFSPTPPIAPLPLQGRLAYMNRRDAAVMPLEARLLASASSSCLTSPQSLTSPQALATPQGGLGGAAPQWLQTLHSAALQGAALVPAALPSMPSMPTSW